MQMVSGNGMNEMILHGHQSFRGAVLWGWLKRFSLQFHFIHWLGYDEAWMRRGLATANRKEMGQVGASPT